MSKPPSTFGKYLRGVDFSNYTGENLDCSRLESLESLQWLKLNNGNFKEIPSIMGLKNLESVTMMKNDLENIEEVLTKMKSIKVLNLRKNNLKNYGKSMKDLDLSNLTILDLSNNRLNNIFPNLSSCKHIMVLNLSRNDISYLPEDIFQCTGIKHLDISYNKIETLSSKIYSCTNLQQMNISENPIHSFPMSDGKSIFHHMKVLHMSRLKLRDVQTELNAFLRHCPAITELDVSNNEIKEIPKSIFKCGKLERLVLNSNLIEVLSSSIGSLKRLKYLSISFNKIREFPSTIGKLKYIKRIYANGNILESTGIPESISNLLSLEYLHLAANKLQSIGTFVLCCVNLKSLNLRNNDLRTLPPLREMMKNLQDLDVRGNPNLIFPRRTVNKDPFASYNFGYENVRNFVVAMLKYNQKLNQEKKLAEKEALEAIKKQKRLNRSMKHRNKVTLSGKIPLPPPLKPSSNINSKKSMTDVRRNIFGIPILDDVDEPDVSDVFPEEVGQNPGIYIMNIENTLPVLIPDELIGTFFSDDCYLILHSTSGHGDSLDHRVFMWIGKNARIEKKACVAVHSITLKGYVGSRESVIRIEDCDPVSFSANVDAIKALELLMPALGGRYQVKDGSASKSEKDRMVKTVKTTFYRLVLNNLKQVKANLWPFLETWIDDRYAYILDRGQKLYLYLGRKSGVSLRVKARLFSEKIKSTDRNDHAEIVDVNIEGEQSSEFWNLLGSKPSDIIMNPSFEKHNDFKPVLYKVVVGQGFIELPQVDQPDGQLKQNLLSSSCAYILDTYYEVYSWYGRKVPIPLRKASDHLAQEILDFVNRPTSAGVIPLRQDFESLVFKSNFLGWADMIGWKDPETSLKASSSYRNSSGEFKKSNESQVVSASSFNLPEMDICSLFLPRSLITSEKSNQIISQSDEDLDSLQSLVMDRQGSLVPLSTHEFGHFFTHSAYAFVCRYSMAVEDDDDESSDQSESEKRENTDEDNEDETDEDSAESTEVDVTKKFCLYFWEGIKAPKSCWLNYSFKYQKIFQQQFKNKLEVIRVQQNHEPLEFKALFKDRFIIHTGFHPSSVPVSEERKDVEPFCELHNHMPKMYQVRTYQRKILSACIETSFSLDNFAKDFCNIIVTKNSSHSRDDSSSEDSAANSNADKCKIYLWIGSEASEEDSEAASEYYVKSLGEAFGCANTIVKVKEVEEPEDFLSLFPSSKFSLKPNEVSIMKWVRLFSFGFRSDQLVIEEIFPFSCFNLRENSVSIVDSGSKLYVYMGDHVNQRLRQFLLKLLPIYQEQQKKKNYGAPERKVVLVKQQKEPNEFKRLFHGWFLD